MRDIRAARFEKSPRLISSSTICLTICAELNAWLTTKRFPATLPLEREFIVPTFV
jgi:hypothetical protein